MSWKTAILHIFSQETDLKIKVITKCVNIKLLDILSCFHYILNAPRTFDLHYAKIGLENQCLVFFFSGGLRLGLLYCKFRNAKHHHIDLVKYPKLAFHTVLFH